MNEKQKTLDNFKYWVDTNTEKGVCSIPDYICNNILNLIQKQDTEINKLNNVIDKMVKHIVEQTYKDLEECEFEDKYNINCNSSKRTCEDCIKEYFMKEGNIGR